jgi:gluconate:H+ symporter, GntP family
MPHPLLAQAAADISYWPLGILAISVAFIFISIVKLKLHPFLALMLSAFFVGLLSKNLPDATTENIGVFKARTDMQTVSFSKAKESSPIEVHLNGEFLRTEEITKKVEALKKKYKKKTFLSLHLIGEVPVSSSEVQLTLAAADQHRVPFALRHRDKIGNGNKLLNTITWSLRGFGDTAGGLCLIIALAAIIGICMLSSGAADRVVRWLLGVFGEKRAGLVLLTSGFLLSIPVFFDTVFFLLIPLARALSLRTGKSYTFFVMAMAGAGAITHSMVPPTPGPLLIAKGLELDLGIAMMAGLAASLLPVWLVLVLAKRFDRKLNLPMREAAGASTSELKSIVDKKDSELPNLFLSALPIALPVILISLVSILKLVAKDAVSGAVWFRYLEFFGSPEIAMLLAALFAIYTLAAQTIREKRPMEGGLMSTLSKALEDPLQTAGVIILITGAGGAFGGMIRLAGVGETIGGLADTYTISYILLAWGATAVVRIAQGSATVAMITGVGLMSAVIGDGSTLPYHKFYIFLAIGFGSITLSWMNDSGFWVVQRLSGFTEKETLKTWTVMLTAISVAGLLQVLVMAKVLPMKPAKPEAKPKQTSQVSSVPASGSVTHYGFPLHRRR